MFAYQEQVSAATKSQLESQVALITMLTNKAFESLEKFIELNVNAAKASFEESTANAQQLLAAKDAQEFLSLVTTQAQLNPEKALAYGRHLFNIVSGAQTEIAKAAEAQIVDSSRKFAALIEDVSKAAPAGSENAFALIKSTLGNVNAGYEQLTKTTKQAVEATKQAVDAIEVNLNTAAAQISQATKASSRAIAVAKK